MKDIIELNNDNKHLIENDDLMLLWFTATWCGPCKMLTPVMDQINSEYSKSLSIIKVDVDNNSELCTKYSIRSVPTILFIKNKEICYKHSGAVPKSYLDSKINEFIFMNE